MYSVGERMHAVLDLSIGFFALLTPEGRVTEASQSALEIEGLERADVVGKLLWETPWWNHLPELREFLRDAVRTAATGNPARGETAFSPAGGTPRRIEILLRPVKDEAARTILLMFEVREMGRHPRAGQTMQQRQSMLRSVLDTIPQFVFWKDRNSVYLGCNQAFAKAIGLDHPDQVVGKTDFDLPWPRAEAEAYRADDAYVMSNNVPKWHINEQVLQADGVRIWVDRSKLPLLDEAGNVYGVLGVYEDITERKQAETALRQNEATLRGLFRAAPVGLTTSAERILSSVNDHFCVITGRSRESLVGHDARQFYGSDEEYERAGRALWDTLWQTGLNHVETRFVRPDGTARDVLLFAAPLDPDDRAAGTVVAVEDITELKRLEAELLQAQKLESVGRLAGGVAHDFNNLLTIINCYVDLLLDELGRTGPVCGKLQEIRKAGEQAANLTRQLLAFSRRQVLQPQILNLNRVVEEMQGMLQRLIGEDLTLVTELAPQLGAVKADPGQLQQVIMNLAVNARDAMPDGGTLFIKTANAVVAQPHLEGHAEVVAGSYVRLTVSDTGQGMDKATQRQIFEPFFTTKESGKGTGLGLSTIWGIVKQSGGHIWVESEHGRGTTFTVYLPRVSEPAADRPSREECLGPHGSETILLVEDQPQLRKLTTEILLELGHKVLAAANAGEALAIWDKHGAEIDLVLTDVIMPGMTGTELARRLRAARPDLNVIYMSGYIDNPVLRQIEIEAGTAYLAKPFTPQGLAAKIRETLAQS